MNDHPMRFQRPSKQKLSAGSMADIAFLLLIFFLVTTQIRSEQGLQLRLPPKTAEIIDKPVNERNLFKIQINSADKLLVENEPYPDESKLKDDVKGFLINHGKDPDLSVSPEQAVVSVKTDRGTSYARFISILDKVKGAYYELRAEQAGISTEEYRNLDPSKPEDLILFEKGKKGFPMQISIAEPTRTE
jgi:biopolymer transport protein ExbD